MTGMIRKPRPVEDIGWRICAPRKHASYAATWLLLTAWLAGCSTLPNDRRWGEDATLAPGWARVGHAAVQAARDPKVWVPLASAAVFQIGGWDQRVSDWERRDTPLFGSQANAERWSNTLRSASVVADGATRIGRVRTVPNDMSLPSGHTTTSAAYTQLASRNLDVIDLDPSALGALDFGLNALTIGTAWARVEASEHFPADTLVGMAIGNFFGHWFDAAFMGLAGQSRTTVAVTPLCNGLALHWEARF
jgi:hypothetical protein